VAIATGKTHEYYYLTDQPTIILKVCRRDGVSCPVLLMAAPIEKVAWQYSIILPMCATPRPDMALPGPVTILMQRFCFMSRCK
jgi:hypothetical protein